MTRIFISYRRQDSEGYVGRLYDHLLKHFRPEDMFMDVASIEPGVDFVEALEKGIAACDICIVVMGPQWATITDASGARRLEQWNDFVRIEVASALRLNKRVIPTLVGGAKMPPSSDLPDDLALLARRNALELSHNRFAADVEDLVNVVRANLSPRPVKEVAQLAETLTQKAAALKIVRDDLVNATASPLYNFRLENRFFPVMGDGNPDAGIMFIGQAPGKVEAAEGRAFVGQSGEVLDEMLRGIGLKREDIFITNLILDRPPENRDPNPAEIAFYAPFVDRLIAIIQPKVVASLGSFAMQYLLKKFDLSEKGGKITDLHGKLIKATLPYGDVHFVPMFHPAVVLYSASQRETLKKDFEKLRIFV